MNPLIVIPAYNVSNKIHGVLTNIVAYKRNTIVINDGSTDETLKHIQQLGFKTVTHDKNKGMGAAIKTGIRFALDGEYSHIITLDGDGQHDSKLIPKFLQLLEKYDLVLANRFQNVANVPSAKLGSNLLGAAIVNTIFKTKLRDISCGFRGFRITSPEMFKYNNDTYGFVFDQLFYCLAAETSYTQISIPTTYYPNELLGTRKLEIECFLRALAPYVPDSPIEHVLDELKQKVANREDFVFKITDNTFFGFYINRNDLYIIQSDVVY